MNLFLSTGQTPSDTARVLAATIGGTVTSDADRVHVTRPGLEAEVVGGEVDVNRYGAPPDPEPDELSVLDGYDVVFTLRTWPRGEELLHREVRAVFDALIKRLPWPVLLVDEMDILVAAWSPALGLTEFPPGTTPDMPHHALWAPYDLPRFDPGT